jgi:GNAT superfamily N-acetyltransferase
MITGADISDIPGIIDCANQLYAAAGYFDQYGLEFDPEAFAAWLSERIGSPGFICLVDSADNGVAGVIAGIVGPWTFNPSISIAYELLYWVKPEYRSSGIGSALLAVYERRVSDLGARNVMAQPANQWSDTVGELYEKRDYKPLELFWIK